MRYLNSLGYAFATPCLLPLSFNDRKTFVTLACRGQRDRCAGGWWEDREQRRKQMQQRALERGPKASEALGLACTLSRLLTALAHHHSTMRAWIDLLGNMCKSTALFGSENLLGPALPAFTNKTLSATHKLALCECPLITTLGAPFSPTSHAAPPPPLPLSSPFSPALSCAPGVSSVKARPLLTRSLMETDRRSRLCRTRGCQHACCAP